MHIKKYFQNLDYWLITAVLLLSLFGLVAISSATRINLGESTSFVTKQAFFVIMGFVLMMIAANVNYDAFVPFHPLIYLINLGLLVFVLFVGSNTNGAVRWITIGPLTIQPSEFAKIMLIFCLAILLKKYQTRIDRFDVLLFLGIYMAIPIILIQLQPALSASLVIVAIFVVMIFIAGLPYVYIRNVAIVVVPIVAFIFWDVVQETPLLLDKVLRPHQFNRILSFVDPSRDASLYYQTEKSISAIGSGQFSGKGLYDGTLNQLSYLPEPHNDFIFSVIGEEFGFIGCIFVLGLLLFVIFRCIVIGIATRDVLGQFIAMGVAGMLAFQTFVNAGVALGLVPNTGMSLPFVGYGGSAMWTSMVSIGLVLNIRKKGTKSLFEGGLL